MSTKRKRTPLSDSIAHQDKIAKRLQKKKTRYGWKFAGILSAPPTSIESTTTFDLPEDLSLVIATIKASLGLSITDLASCLKTTRQTIYTWIREESKPQLLNHARLTELYKIAIIWQKSSSIPAKECFPEISDLLSGHIDAGSAISTLTEKLAMHQPQQKSNLELLLEKHGIDKNKLSKENEQFDIITGKSNSFGDLNEPDD